MRSQPGLPRSSVGLVRSSPGPTPPLFFPTFPWPPPWEHRADDSRLLATTDGRRELKKRQGSSTSGTHMICGANLQTHFTADNSGRAQGESSHGKLPGLCFHLLTKRNCEGLHPGHLDTLANEAIRTLERQRSPMVPELCHLPPGVTARSPCGLRQVSDHLKSW